MATCSFLRVASLLSLTVVCACAARPDRSAQLAELRASQSEPYAVPPTDAIEFTVGATLAAVVWAQLTEDQLLDWERCWRAVRDAPDRPTVAYDERLPDGGTRRANLFDRSPKDGFCVAEALTSSQKPLQNERVRTTMQRIQDGLRER